MKKASFKITIIRPNPGEQEVNGWIGRQFGTHKESGIYVVTHLRTGARVSWFNYLKNARDFIDRMEKAAWKQTWDTNDVQAITKVNGPKTKAIEAIARGIQGVVIPE